jgi:hypothetical protein
MSNVWYDNTQGNADAMQYGLELDPAADSDMWKGLGYREDSLADILKIMGIYPEDLLGLPPEPTMPEGGRYESDFVNLYGGNRTITTAASLIEQGVMPREAARQAIEATGVEGDEDEVAELASQFATQFQEQTRKQGEYDRQMSAYEQYNNPRVVGESAAPGDDLMAQYAMQRGRKAIGSDQDVVDRRAYSNRALGGPAAGTVRPGAGGVDVPQLIGGRLRAPVQTGRGVGAQAAASVYGQADDMSRRARELMREKEMQRVIPAGRDQANAQRAALAWQLLGGVPAPTR